MTRSGSTAAGHLRNVDETRRWPNGCRTTAIATKTPGGQTATALAVKRPVLRPLGQLVAFFVAENLHFLRRWDQNTCGVQEQFMERHVSHSCRNLLPLPR